VQDAFVLRQVGHVLRRAYAIARRNSAEALSQLGDVSPVQGAVLGALTRGALTQAEIGRQIGMEPANAHTIVRRMAAAGLVEIGRDPNDRRVVLAALTDAGATIVARLDACMDVATERTLASLDPDERHALLALLTRIVNAEVKEASASNALD
jgi:DNA-binding MarR family transcriptional regulator